MILDSKQQLFVFRVLGKERAQRLALSECRGCRKIPATALGVLRQTDGRIQLRAYCPTCTTRWGRVRWRSDALPHCNTIVEDLGVPIVVDNLNPGVLCERCGDGSQGVQEHHWAPKSVFGGEAYDWPTSNLCPSCHAEWHLRTGIGDGWFKKEAA